MTHGGRRNRLRARLDGSKEASVDLVEAYLAASGWMLRKGRGGHRAWIKDGKRTLVIPVHGSKVRVYVIRQVLEATREDHDE